MYENLDPGQLGRRSEQARQVVAETLKTSALERDTPIDNLADDSIQPRQHRGRQRPPRLVAKLAHPRPRELHRPLHDAQPAQRQNLRDAQLARAHQLDAEHHAVVLLLLLRVV